MSYSSLSSLRLSIFKTSIFLAVLGLAATLATVTPVTSVQAQDAGAALEEIVVTARRREESLLEVPVAISVLDGNFIAEAGILDHYDLYAETPGIEYTQSFDRLGSRPAIRGVSTTAQNILFGNNLTDEDAPRELRGLRNDREIGGRTPRNYRYLPRIPRELGVRADFSF